MPIRIEAEDGGRTVVVHVTGKLQKADYGGFRAAFDPLVRAHGKLRVLFDMVDFHGWDAGAAWEDLKFGVAHFSDIERLALVGEQQWQHAMATIARPFTRATVRYFDRADAAQARLWLSEAQP
jgi:hypothetical protein